MVHNKIGFHFGSQSSAQGWGDYVRRLDAAGIPAVLMSVAGEGFGDIYAQWEAGSQVPHVVCIRYGGAGIHDVPPYGANQRQAAVDWWAWYKPLIGPDAHKYKERIVLKMGNELDKNQAEWLAGFYLELYDILQNDPDGPWRMAAFNYSGGEPEPEHWRGPVVQEYLRLCASDPVGAAVGLHEYSFQNVLNIGNYSLIGRFTELFAACDEAGIKRPNVYIHEFGWRQDTLPDPTVAMAQIPWAAELYASYPEVKGAGIWTLQSAGSYGDINLMAQKLIAPITEYSLVARFPDPEPVDPPDGGNMTCNPRVPYSRKYLVVPQDVTEARWLEICKEAYAQRNTVAFSYDDAGHAPGVSSNTAVLYDIPQEKQQEFLAWYAEHYPETAVEFRGGSDPGFFRFEFWPTNHKVVTQAFGANPDVYAPYNLPGHEGVDIRAPHGSAVYAVAAGTVVKVGDDRENAANGGHNYGVRIYIDHSNGWQTIYAHLDERHVGVGQSVKAGQLIGNADDTGNSFGSHLHLTLKRAGHTYIDKEGNVWPLNIFDPTPAMAGFEYTSPGTDPKPPVYSGPAVKFVSGVDQPASDWYWSAAKAVFETSKLAPKFHAGGNNYMWWNAFRHAEFNLVRVLLAPDFAGDAQAIFNETTGNVSRFYAQGARDFELLNEPNIEGMGKRWNNGREFGTVFRELCKMYRSAYPGIRLWYPGMSPGFGAQHQFIAESVSVGAFDYIYGMCEHVYTGITHNAQEASDQMLAEVKGFQTRWALTRPLAITEFSVNRPASGAYKASVYERFYAALTVMPGIQAAYSFTASWHPSLDGNREGWLENGIHNYF